MKIDYFRQNRSFARPVLAGVLIVGTLVPLPGVFLHAAEITVRADREPVHLDESFNLIFRVHGSSDGDPDFTPLLEDFEILNRGQSSNISIINGNYTTLAQWHLTVLPRKTGKLAVPSIKFGDDESQAIFVTVNEPVSFQVDPENGELLPNVFLETEVKPENPYVQAQLIFTARLLHRVNLTQARLSEPQVNNAVVEKLGDDVSYNTRRQGFQYRVVERKYAVFPQKSGVLIIEALELNAEILTAGQGDSRFDGLFGRRATRTKRVRSNPTAVKVKPIPEEFTGRSWLPAERLTLTDGWSEKIPTLAPGEPITRTLRMEASGLSSGQLPELSPSDDIIQAEDGGAIKQYADKSMLKMQKTATGLTSIREQKVALIPSRAGTYQLPAVEIPWWNTKTDRMEIARIPELTVTAIASGNEKTPLSDSSSESEDFQETPMVGSIRQSEKPDEPIWKWASLILALGWLSTLVFLWIGKRRRGHMKTITLPGLPDRRAAVRAVKTSCTINDPRMAKTALLDWAKAVWVDSPPSSLGEIGEHLGGKLKTEIEILNRNLYGKKKSGWNGEALWRALSEYLRKKTSKNQARTIGLEPLYKL